MNVDSQNKSKFPYCTNRKRETIVISKRCDFAKPQVELIVLSIIIPIQANILGVHR